MSNLTDAIEGTKLALLMKGRDSSEIINDVLTDLSLLLKPNCKTLHKKNDVLPFEDVNSLEFLNQKNETSLFLVGNHTKKRPHNITMGRLYDGHLLDMFEFGVENFHKIKDFPGQKKGVGSKPMLVFAGDQWETDSLFNSIQNVFVDFFRGDKPDKISMKGIDHVVSFTCSDSKIYIRTYVTNYQKTESKFPQVVLKPMGPIMDLNLRRHQKASDDLMKVACKKAVISNQPNKVKNINRDSMGDKFGRIHTGRQDFDKMGGRQVKALRKVSGRHHDGEGGAEGRRDGTSPSKKRSNQSTSSNKGREIKRKRMED